MTAPRKPRAKAAAISKADTAPTTDQPVPTAAQPSTEGANPAADSTQDATDDDRTTPAATGKIPQPTTEDGRDLRGNVPVAVAETAADYVDDSPALVALAREGESRAACWERLRKEARAAGMPRNQGPGTAYEWATRETDRLFPPKLPDPDPILEAPAPKIVDTAPPAEPPEAPKIVDTSAEEEPAPAPKIVDTADQGVSGLGDLPDSWGELPANAQLQVEIAWVSANRLKVRSGNGVDLSRSLSPAPSYSALSWLETSILFPSKFADISVKATAQQDDEKEHIRREKMAIEEIRGLLAEMLEG